MNIKRLLIGAGLLCAMDLLVTAVPHSAVADLTTLGAMLGFTTMMLLDVALG